MRRLLLAASCGICLAANSGCIVPIYSGDPAVRTEELIFNSEDMRQAIDDWRRIWFLDQPSHLTPLRTHGGLL